MRTIGLIAGNGQLPIIWAKNASREKVKVIAFAFKGETEKNLASYVDKIYWLNIGRLNDLINILNSESVHEAVMIGQIKPAPFLFKSFFSKDRELKNILKQAKDKRGSSLLSAFADRLKKEGINLLDSRTFIADYLPRTGNLTKVKINQSTQKDIDFGFKLAKQLANLDIGQTIVVKDLAVLAVEAIEGTNQTILRGAKLGGLATVVVKVSRPQHDMRFDIPVIGPKTIHYLEKAKSKAIAIEAQRTLIVDKDKTIREAERKQIAIIAL